MLTLVSSTLYYLSKPSLNIEKWDFVRNSEIDEKRKLTEKHNMLPLVRERIETLHVLTVREFKDYIDKARKIHQKLFYMQDYELPSELEEMSEVEKIKMQYISQKEISDLINALKMQPEFLHETEITY